MIVENLETLEQFLGIVADLGEELISICAFY